MITVPAAVLVPALIWMTLLLVGGGLVLIRARDAIRGLVALDMLAVLVISLLALLSYLRDAPYYFDAAVALSLLSFVSTVATARYLGSGGPFG
ncbi:multisubunit Na+/H+ antiporter, MnhF subunit [Saccharomonospora cyanea NA-134]|uniref:Multisubunit Na+/H+ antiporter, MnhF subunit n=1 Tax=Saccharomonospora cyanea NA-134 TaxID=882082 RepID=H5XIK9_9PSEU|nr:multisubunit Na+/H+ antiporter, MnhF subunit [Saccharomonospora cyanea NA-134]